MESFQEKGNPIQESAYFSWEDSYIYFGSKDGLGRFKFNYEKTSPTEEIPNFLAPINKLLSIVNQYDEVELNDKFVFSNGKDKYKINTIVDDDQIDTSIFNTKTYESSLVFCKNHLDKINRAVSFTNKDDSNANFQAVFIEDGYIIGMSSKTPVFESQIDLTDKLCIPVNVAKTILQVGDSVECTLYYDSSEKTKKIVSSDGELEVIVPSINGLDFPPIRSTDFIESYSYPTLLKVDTMIFSKTLDSLKSYFNDILNSKIKIKIGDDLTILVEDTNTNIEKHMEYIEVSDELKNQSYSISGTKLLQVLGTLRGSELVIQLPLDSEKPIINFYNDEEQHILVTRFKED
jgi:hypothetical protein